MAHSRLTTDIVFGNVMGFWRWAFSLERFSPSLIPRKVSAEWASKWNSPENRLEPGRCDGTGLSLDMPNLDLAFPAKRAHVYVSWKDMYIQDRVTGYHNAV